MMEKEFGPLGITIGKNNIFVLSDDKLLQSIKGK